MKQRIIPYLFGILTSALILGGFLVGRASAAPTAATGCFPDTNSHWAETFICWLKDNGITTGYGDGTYKPDNSVTRAEMSVFLQKIFNLADASAQNKANIAEANAIASAQTSADTAEANAKAYAETLIDNPPTSGDFVIGAGPSVWTKSQNSSSPFVEIYPNFVYLKTNFVATFQFQATIPVPVVSYGKAMQLKGLRLCYTVGANTEIQSVNLVAYRANSGLPTPYNQFTDNVVRTDSTCRNYSIVTPSNFEVGDFVSVSVNVNFLQTSGYVQIGSTSLILGPTNTSVTWP
ncbi:MAG TPA: S-layer homology domain-containing protein [Anaerolineales bacterium]|nr:S-layer homology domain-containing protein [Anaerolineales bacterium]